VQLRDLGVHLSAAQRPTCSSSIHRPALDMSAQLLTPRCGTAAAGSRVDATLGDQGSGAGPVWQEHGARAAGARLVSLTVAWLSTTRARRRLDR
jgi:hypothetical protein